MAEFRWRKSSRSGPNNLDCVEVALLPEATAVRDSKAPAGARLEFSAARWEAFSSHLKNGHDGA